jgi:hypothetical protein
MIDETKMKNNELDNNDTSTNTILNVSYLTSGMYNTENKNKNDKNDKNDKNEQYGDISTSIMNKKTNYNKLSNGISNILNSPSYKTLFDK